MKKLSIKNRMAGKAKKDLEAAGKKLQKARLFISEATTILIEKYAINAQDQGIDQKFIDRADDIIGKLSEANNNIVSRLGRLDDALQKLPG